VIGAAIPEERHEKKWIEGIAIWVAIFLVTLVSECPQPAGFSTRPAWLVGCSCRTAATAAARCPDGMRLWACLRQQAHMCTALPADAALHLLPTLPPHLLLLLLHTGALNDYQKDLQFRKLNAQKDVIDVKVVRSGKTCVIKNSEIVVGDILMLDTGAHADG
jgi:hypothetical protein